MVVTPGRTGQGEGMPETWIKEGTLTVRMVNGMTDLHIWAAVGAGLFPTQGTEMDDTWSMPVD